MNILRYIIKYQIQDMLRNKWLIFYTLFFLALSYSLLSFSSDAGKVILSLLNIITIVVPLASLIFGTVFFYTNNDYIIFMLSQPINRKYLYSGLLFGLAITSSMSFVIGIGLPLVFFFDLFLEYKFIFIELIIIGILETFIFISIAFLVASINDNKLKGLGLSIFIWLLFSALYDGIFLIILQVFRDYPMEVPSLIISMMNPVDLARLTIILEFDKSVFMGYTGAVFENMFGDSTGIMISVISLIIWCIVPLLLGLRSFIKKDF